MTRHEKAVALRKLMADCTEPPEANGYFSPSCAYRQSSRTAALAEALGVKPVNAWTVAKRRLAKLETNRG